MGLDAHVRCRCIQDGLAKPHPFAKRLTLDENVEPVLPGDSTSDDWDLHENWFAESCEHGGYIVSERLGNISLIAHLREFVRHLQSSPAPRFPILLEHVIYDGTHTGDRLASIQAQTLLEEVNVVLQSSDILSAPEKEFFESVRRLCQASIKTGNPIVF
jgi:hypothetical protein